MKEKRSFASEFLRAHRYRFGRYVFFGLAGGVITSSMVFVAYMDCSSRLGNRIYLLCLSLWIGYAVAMLLHYHYLIPNFLLKGKYGIYSILLFAAAYVLPSLSILQEYYVRSAWKLPHRITSYASPWILVDNLSSCMLLLICFLGVAVIRLFREWKNLEEQLSRMEQAHLLSEVNKLKGQIAPSFLSETLKNAVRLIPTNPSKANEVLMQLGRLLRYQLYDCKRDEVLLASEINHLNTFLYLKQLNKEGFSYEIRTSGDLNTIRIPPLLFISFTQSFAEQSTFLRIDFTQEGRSLFFNQEADGEERWEGKTLELLKQRLDLQYPGKYEFNSKTDSHSDLKIDPGINIETQEMNTEIKTESSAATKTGTGIETPTKTSTEPETKKEAATETETKMRTQKKARVGTVRLKIDIS